MSDVSGRLQGPSSESRDSSISRTALRPRSVGWLLLAVLFIVGLSLRLVSSDGAVTEDEDQWIHRAGDFSRAFASHRWSGTYQTGHPGVTTMWLVRLTLGEERAVSFTRFARSDMVVSEVPGFLEALHDARLPFAMLEAGLAVVIGALSWRLLGAGPGLLAGLLSVTEPYAVAMSPIVGMDGVLGGLLTASLLIAMLALDQWAAADLTRSRRVIPSLAAGTAALSGLVAGLAVLTKATGVVLLPGVMFLVGWSLATRTGNRPAVRTLGFLAAWGLGFLAAMAIWPALWSNPIDTIGRAIQYDVKLGSIPHPPGNYFLGQPTADPGPLFYPVVLALRSGPATMIGLLALLLWGMARGKRSVLARVGLLCVGYVVLVSLSPKKIDRYALPALILLEPLAGYGLWRAIVWVRRLLPGAPELAVAAIGLLQLFPLAATQPYALAAFNPLAGGARAAERAIPVGWGEGLEVVGEWLAKQPDAERAPAAIWAPLYVNFRAHAPGPVVRLDALESAAYYVEYIHMRQRGLTPRSLRGHTPQFVVRIAGIDYVRVYRL